MIVLVQAILIWLIAVFTYLIPYVVVTEREKFKPYMWVVPSTCIMLLWLTYQL